MHLKKKWKLPKENLQSSNQLSKNINLSLISSQILVNRGITTPKEAESFLYTPVYSPSFSTHIPNLKEGAEIIINNIKNKKKLMIYGDFDVDGITAITLLYEALTYLNADVIYYIPHRFNEGYGLNKQVIDKCKNDGISLIITVDCGVSNVDEIIYANENKIDVLVTDHHEPPTILPPAKAIINPKLNKEITPSTNLSGVGVVFKLIEEIYLSNKKDFQINLEDCLDLVALGTISDIVPLLGENRILTVNGLKKLNTTKRPGLKCLCQLSKIKTLMGTKEVGFYIGPRLNAAGRLEHASIGVELLLSKSSDNASHIANKLNKLNSTRQKMTQKIKDDVENKIKNEIDLEKDKAILVSSSNWHPGIIGIVASQLAKKYSRPTILISEKEEMARGSGRSIPNFNLFNVLKNTSSCLNSFGGHPEAVGFTIHKDKIPELKNNIALLMDDTIDNNLLHPLINIDAKINAEDISLATAKELLRFQPHGSMNPQPTLACYDLNILDYILVGNGQHLKATFTDTKGKVLLDTIGFNMANYISTLKKGPVNLAFSIEVNDYNNFESTQLKLADIQSNDIS